VRGDGTVTAVDWEDAGSGPGVLDLAQLTTGWDPATVSRLTDAYEAGLGSGVDRRLVGLARLHTCVRWLGWSPDWAPPSTQRRDWWGEALACAREVGL
jgi:thiamine kinase-like enzyme